MTFSFVQLSKGTAESQICGTGQEACCAGSNDGCPPEAPGCSKTSEWVLLSVGFMST